MSGPMISAKGEGRMNSALGRATPKRRLSKLAMKAKASSQAEPVNRKARRAQAKARKMMGDA
jgi:hypothetical protein